MINLHKYLSNVDSPKYYVRLNATKCSTLHAIQMYFINQINCNFGLKIADVTALDVKNVNFIRQDYLDHAQLLALTEGLVMVTIHKLISPDWINFKSAIIKFLGQSIGCMGIPLLYVMRESNEGDVDDRYACLRDKLVSFTQISSPSYQANNGDVLSLLVQHTNNMEDTYMVKSNQQRRNGCKAW